MNIVGAGVILVSGKKLCINSKYIENNKSLYILLSLKYKVTVKKKK